MHHTARTAPVTSTARPRSPAAVVLAAVVLTVLATLGISGPPPGTSWAVAGAASAADCHGHDGTRADDGCDTSRVVRAAARHEQHGEHPGPRGHPGTCGPSADAAPCPLPSLYEPPPGHVPSSRTHAAQDQGRAPPMISGT
ncbi:hypothetical protein ACFWMJ_03565 [Streptomyces hawaiiensis]|uniref:hypothetical protein n=1 Tax=Streptomyces hawaiiensis TaxID=67305 RepID=UPI00365E9BC7